VKISVSRPGRRHAHFVFGAVQSGMTSLIASGFGSAPLWGSPDFFQSWLRAWALSWAVMLPVVLLAAPWIRKLAHALTKEDDARITPP
jgi:hypothetical protein